MNSSTNPYPDCKNGTILTSLLGLNYTQYCNQDCPGNDIKYGTEDTFEKCLEACTRLVPGCYGVVWNPVSGYCWSKTNSVGLSSLVRSANMTCGLVSLPQITQNQSEIVCPYINLSKRTTTTGLNFTILCGADVDGDGIYDRNVDSASAMHADSMEECLENCANSHPLCTRVSYLADSRGGGWLNCWPKAGVTVQLTASATFLKHSANALIPTLKKADCKTDSALVATDGRNFKVSCDDWRVLNDATTPPLETSHQASVEDCTNRCASTNSTCTSVVFDVGLQSGYRNCYLFNSIPSAGKQRSNYTLLYDEAISSQYKPPSKTSAPNKSWIAGPVVGGCAVLTILAWFWFWYRKHKSKKHELVKIH